MCPASRMLAGHMVRAGPSLTLTDRAGARYGIHRLGLLHHW